MGIASVRAYPDACILIYLVKDRVHDEFWTNDQRLAKAAQNKLRIVTFESTP